MKIKIYFSFPKFENITIFNQEDYWLRKLLFKKKKVITIPAFPNIDLYLSLGFLIHFLFFFLFYKKFDLKSVIKNFYYSYLISILDYSKTKKVVTFIDNSKTFHILSKIDKKRKYFAIQNGIRGYSDVKKFLPKGYKIYMQNFFCFSEREKKLFKKYNHKILNYIPVGSLKGSYFYDKLVRIKKKKYDLCYVSQLQERFFNGFYGNKYEKISFTQYKRTINLTTDFLIKLLKEKNYSLVICLRTRDNDFEYNYYKKKFSGFNCEIIWNKKELFSSYHKVTQSHLTIGHDTTLLHETYKYNKLLWYNPYNYENFKVIEAGKCYFNNNSYNKFKKKVEYLYKFKKNDFFKFNEKNSKNICYNDKKIPAYKLIMDELENV